MSYKKHMQIVPVQQLLQRQLAKSRDFGDLSSNGSSANYSSPLPEVYEGSPLRIDRYGQYDAMDNDSEVNAALDTIADFCTQKDVKTDEVFTINYRKEASETEVEILKTCLMQWSKINDFKRRIWRMFRSTLKYGDQFFVRDPETLRWFYVDPSKVEKILVNEAEGKQPEAYVFRDLDLNLSSFTATAPEKYGTNLVGGASQMTFQRPTKDSKRWGNGNPSTGRFDGETSLTAVEATHVVHLSLSEGLDANWPFGTSILESVFKVWKEKGLLEEAIIIYRIQRAPERRVFYIDVGGMPLHKVGGYLEKVKNEIHQRRFPSRTGGGANMGDATYNPMSMMEDFFFAQSAEGRGSRVETLPAGENLGQIDDLKYWTNKLLRGLRVPSSYLPTGPEDGTQSFNDGRVGTAYIQEFRFAQYCQRLQNLLAPTFDDEFKLFVKRRGFDNIDVSMFDLNFNMPENFGTFAKIERDAAAINVYQPLAEIKHFSKRWLMMEYLGLTEEQINENERMWREENRDITKGTGADDSFAGSTPVGMEGIGIRPQDEMDMGDDMGSEDMEGMDEPSGDASPISGDEGSTDSGEDAGL
jgi:hypothetical protein